MQQFLSSGSSSFVLFLRGPTGSSTQRVVALWRGGSVRLPEWQVSLPVPVAVGWPDQTANFLGGVVRSGARKSPERGRAFVSGSSGRWMARSDN